ncbi:MAG: hypothetical protein IKB45_02550 [Clostridia bacterium]|nr:hypothetical protein [Clostridia bacterium]
MKKNFKILALLVAAILICTCFTACKKSDKDSVSDPDVSTVTSDISKPDTSSETDTSSDETVTASEPETSSSEPTTSSEKPVSSTPSSSKPAPSTPSSTPKPSTTPSTPQTPAKKTPKELIIGKWKGLYDFAPAFAEIGYDLGTNSKVAVTMEFTTSGSYITSLDSVAFKNLLRPAIQQEINNDIAASGMSPDEYDQAFIENSGMSVSEYIEEVLTIFDQGWNAITEYKFASDTLLIKDTESGAFVECEYEFTNDNTLITIDGENRTTYTRVS